MNFSRRKDKPTMHNPEALVNHHIAYSAKFLGITEVDHPKGTDVVRTAVRKLKFQRHIKKSEGEKVPKVELQISIYGIQIMDPKTKDVQHNCQLYRMSFCADDKTDKRIFAFICTEPDTKRHLCYVFDSEKCAEEITIAIGQAFDLAYKKFLESGGKDVETRKQIGNLQKRIQDLEAENSKLKTQLQDLEEHLRYTQSSAYMLSSMLSCSPENFTSLSSLEISSVTLTPVSSPDSNQSVGLLTPPTANPNHLLQNTGYSVPPLCVNVGSLSVKMPSTDLFDMVPFTPESSVSEIPVCNGTPTFSSTVPKNQSIDLFGAVPFDPFTSGPTDYFPDIQSKLDEIQEGFKMGLTLEATIFSLDQVDSQC